MGQTHLVPEHHWPSHFERLANQSEGALTVSRLRAWTDEPRPMGLPREVQNLLILCFAEQADRSFYRQGGRVRPSLERLDDGFELREQPLPSREEWDRARHLGEALFGLTPPAVLNAGNVDRLVEQIRDKAGHATAPLARLVQHIEARLRALELNPDTADRVTTLRNARALLAAVDAADSPLGAVQSLARAETRTSEGAMSAAFARVGALDPFLQNFEWTLLDSVRSVSDSRRDPADAILKRVGEAFAADEHVQPLEAVLKTERANALRLLADTGTKPPPPAPPPLPPGQVIAERQVTDLSGSAAIQAIEDLRSRLAAEPDAHLSLSWRLTREKRP